MRKRSSESLSGPSSELPDARISPTRFENACSRSSSARPVSRLGRVVRQITPTSLPGRTIGAQIDRSARVRRRWSPSRGRAARGARAPRGPALPRRPRSARERWTPFSSPSPMTAARRIDSPSSSARKTVPALDVVERDQPARAASSASRPTRRRPARRGRARGGGRRRRRRAGRRGGPGRPSAPSACGSISWRLTASATAWARLDAPSFAIALRMCVRTVSGESTRVSAIWAPLYPAGEQAEDLALAR